LRAESLGYCRFARHHAQCVSVLFSAIRRELSKKIDTIAAPVRKFLLLQGTYGRNPFYFKGFAERDFKGLSGRLIIQECKF
jgi:hypothetical protein